MSKETVCVFGKRAFEKGESGCMLGFSGGAAVDDIPGHVRTLSHSENATFCIN